MKKLIPVFAFLALQGVSAAAETLADQYLDQSIPELSEQEKAGLTISEQAKNRSEVGIKPIKGEDGSVNFLFGASQPSIVCAVLEVCDVELQAGEVVNGIHLGDAHRWTVDPSITGTGSEEKQHLIIKPHDVGLSTSLIVTTNRRTYSFQLRSHPTSYMARITFTYPEDAMARWEKLNSSRRVERQQATIPETGEYLGNLSFAYKVDGSAKWKPVRVYNDGVKTIIQMPETMSQSEAPILLVMRGDDSVVPWGDKAEEVIVNYRVQGDRYIVDSVFDKAVLAAGVGSRKEAVTITRKQ